MRKISFEKYARRVEAAERKQRKEEEARLGFLFDPATSKNVVERLMRVQKEEKER